MCLREMERIDIKTFHLVQNVLSEKYCFLLSSSNLRFGSFQLTFCYFRPKAANPMAMNLHNPALPVSAMQPSVGSPDDFWWHMSLYIFFLILIVCIHFNVH